MDFQLTKEQQMLSDVVQRFVAKEYTFERRRSILQSADGWSRDIWSKLAEMGLLSLQVPEEYGGMGRASVETLLTMNAFGRALLLEPYLQSAILATALVADLGSPAQKEALLPLLATGERIAVPAHVERGSRYDLSMIGTTAVRKGGEFLLSGRKEVVLHGAAADLLLVSARTGRRAEDEAGISLFVVARKAPGIS